MFDERRMTTPPPWAWSWRCSSSRSCSCAVCWGARGPLRPAPHPGAHPGIMALLAAALGTLLLLDLAGLSTVYVFALALGVVATFDAPVRQTFVSEMVPDTHLSNAVALLHLVQLRVVHRPAVAGVLAAAVGTGWCSAHTSHVRRHDLGNRADRRRAAAARPARPPGRGQIRRASATRRTARTSWRSWPTGPHDRHLRHELRRCTSRPWRVRSSARLGGVRSPELDVGPGTCDPCPARRERARLRDTSSAARRSRSRLGQPRRPRCGCSPCGDPRGASLATIMTTANAYAVHHGPRHAGNV
ncbi:MFS transporter [Kocuria rhizophila]|nr:MFS transporter [Kocuria rhizophila]